MTSTETRSLQERLRNRSRTFAENGMCLSARDISEAADRIDALERVESVARAIFSTREGAYGTALWERNLGAFVQDIEALRAALHPQQEQSE